MAQTAKPGKVDLFSGGGEQNGIVETPPGNARLGHGVNLPGGTFPTRVKLGIRPNFQGSSMDRMNADENDRTRKGAR